MSYKEINLSEDVTVRELVTHLQTLDQDSVVRLESTFGFPLRKIAVYTLMCYLSGDMR